MNNENKELGKSKRNENTKEGIVMRNRNKNKE